MGISITKIAQLTGHKGAVYGLDRSESGKIYSGGADGYVVEWDVEKEYVGNLLATLKESVYAVRVFDNLLLAGSATGSMLAVDLKTKKALFHRKVHPGGIFDFFVSRDWIYIFGEKGTVTILNREFKPIKQKQLLGESIRQALPYGNDKFLLACSDHTIKFADRENLVVFEVIDAHDFSVFSLAVNEAENKLYSGSRDATIKVWDTEKYNEIQRVPAHLLHVNGLAYNAEHNLLLSASMDKSIRLWNADTMKLLKVVDMPKFGMHSNSVNKVLWIGANRFISCSDDRSLGYFLVEL